MDTQIFKEDYFQLFGLKQGYIIDKLHLQAKMRELQKKFHPDNFLNQGEELSTQALAISGHINHAYNTLKTPLLRAIYLLELYGIKVDLIHDTKFSHEFLLKQIDLREQISEAADALDLDQLTKIEEELLNKKNKLEQEITTLFTLEHYPPIIELIKQLAFYNKLEQVVNSTLSNLE